MCERVDHRWCLVSFHFKKKNHCWRIGDMSLSSFCVSCSVHQNSVLRMKLIKTSVRADIIWLQWSPYLASHHDIRTHTRIRISAAWLVVFSRALAKDGRGEGFYVNRVCAVRCFLHTRSLHEISNMGSGNMKAGKYRTGSRCCWWGWEREAQEGFRKWGST